MNRPLKEADAIALLAAEHRRIRQLFDDYADSAGQEEHKRELARQICFELSVHALLEEEIFYPAMRAARTDDGLLDEAEAAHAGARELIRQLEAMQAGEGPFDALVEVLSGQVGCHVGAEEGAMFPMARQAGLDIGALGRQIGLRRLEIENGFDGAPAPETIHRSKDSSRKPARR